MGALWRRQHDGLYFRRQRSVGSFIADFSCDVARLVVEVDGAVHAGVEQSLHDRDRDAAPAEAGYVTLRFGNDGVLGQLRSVLAHIRAAAHGRWGIRAASTRYAAVTPTAGVTVAPRARSEAVRRPADGTSDERWRPSARAGRPAPCPSTLPLEWP